MSKFWDEHTNKVIDTYVNDKCLSEQEREDLFATYIYPALVQLVNVVIARNAGYRINIQDIESVIADTVVKLTRVLPLYDERRGHKRIYTYLYYIADMHLLSIWSRHQAQKRKGVAVSIVDNYNYIPPINDGDAYTLDDRAEHFFSCYEREYPRRVTSPIYKRIKEVLLRPETNTAFYDEVQTSVAREFGVSKQRVGQIVDKMKEYHPIYADQISRTNNSFRLSR